MQSFQRFQATRLLRGPDPVAWRTAAKATATLLLTLVLLLPQHLPQQAEAALREHGELYKWQPADGLDEEALYLWASTAAPSSNHSTLQAPQRTLLDSAHTRMPPLRYYTSADITGNSPDEIYDHQVSSLEVGKQRRCSRCHCRATRGDWCGAYERQRRLPAKAAPRGSKECQAGCNGVGVCDHDLGICLCPAGWTGTDCSTRELRPCSNRGRQKGPVQKVLDHVDENGRDRNWLEPGWMAGRCGGICDTETSQCWCDGAISKYGHIPAPQGSPPGTPPVQRGRPLSEYCKPAEDQQARKTGWGVIPYANLYGPEGWCNAEAPADAVLCACQQDWLEGRTCEEVVESTCVNQCSGRGSCTTGFCKCYDGWYGSDCSRKRAGLDIEPSDIESGRKPWLAPVVIPPTAAEPVPPAGATRKRPLIFVYDMPSMLTSRMLQYRLVRRSCVWRHFTTQNRTAINDWIYAVELYLHEMLLTSPHRTFDPEEADYFYVPLYITCYFWPTLGWSDMPWWGAPSAPRPMQGAAMMGEALAWIKAYHGKYWERRQGRDHIFLMAHDEGACWAPTEIYRNSIMLTHWGRLDEDHQSNTGYGMDNYNEHNDWAEYQPYDWRKNISGHACYDPDKDLVIPSLKPPEHYRYSPLLGHPPMQRDILFFFKGDVGQNREKCRPAEPHKCYSRGIRQTLHKLSIEHKWREAYKVFVCGPSDQACEGEYSQVLARSLFCLVAPGDGWSARAEDSILHGCIPVVIMDNVHAVFESILDWDSFGVRIPESSISQLPHLLLAYTPQQLARMQRRLATVWHRFAYAQSPVYQAALRDAYATNGQTPGPGVVVPDHHPLKPLQEFPVQKDAFSTILQWLYARIPHTRGQDTSSTRNRLLQRQRTAEEQ